METLPIIDSTSPSIFFCNGKLLLHALSIYTVAISTDSATNKKWLFPI